MKNTTKQKGQFILLITATSLALSYVVLRMFKNNIAYTKATNTYTLSLNKDNRINY